MSNATDRQEWIAGLRERLRGWGTYGPRPYGYGWEALPIDEMTDEQVIETAKNIASEGKST